MLAVPPKAACDAPSAVLFRTILCPVDLSEESLAGLELASSMAAEARAHLVVLHVVERPDPDDPRSLLHFGSTDYVSFLELDAREKLQAAIPREGRELSPEIVIASGKPAEEILRVAGEREAGFIVLGVRRHHTLGTFLFGSTAEHVVRGGACPVLTVRVGREELARRREHSWMAVA